MPVCKEKVKLLDKDLADFALKYATGKKVDYAEVRAHSGKNEEFVMKNSVLDAYVSMVDSGFCIRVPSRRWNRLRIHKQVD